LDDARVKTEFAPAERVTPEELKRQVATFGQRALLREVLDPTPVAVMGLNSCRQIIYGNLPLLRVVGAKALRDVLGLRPGETLYCIHAFENPGGCGTTRFCRECGAVRAIQSSLLGEYSVAECSIARRQHEVVEALDLRVWATPLRIEDEEFVIFSLMDIAHERRRQVLERIFFHDILNTAAALQSASEFMLLDEGGEQRDIVGLIYASAQSLVQEIRTQRDLLAAENGSLQVNLQVVDTLPLLQQLLELYRHHPVAKDRVLSIAPGAEAVSFVSDPTLLGRVLGNMLKNALEASAPGECVTLNCGRLNSHVAFTVHNSSFMPESVQLQIFQRSFSTKGPGRGLGTYSMRLLSERYLNGEITFESSPENGTTFAATYPLRPET